MKSAVARGESYADDPEGFEEDWQNMLGVERARPVHEIRSWYRGQCPAPTPADGSTPAATAAPHPLEAVVLEGPCPRLQLIYIAYTQSS